jgi:hypothetical protein
VGVTYSEGLNGSELLYNCLLLSEVRGADSQSSSSNDWQTDGDTDNQEDKSVMEQVVGAVLWGCDVQVAEETTNPGDEDPANDQDQERRANGVHDRLEMTGILSSRNERRGATDERHLGRVSDNAISLSTLATGSVVDNISDILVDSEGLSSHGRLIDGEERVSRAVLLSVVIVIFLSLRAVA